MATKQTILKWAHEDWMIFNLVYFNGRLPKPRFYVFCDDSWQGQWTTCKDGIERISFNPDWIKSRKYFRTILLHEMIHQAQWNAKSARTRREQHGRFFQYNHVRIFGFPYIVSETY